MQPIETAPGARVAQVNLQRSARIRATRRGAWQGLRQGIVYVVLVITSLMMAFPLLWMIVTSFKTEEEANAPQLVWLPAQPQWEAYGTILRDAAFVQAYANSLFVVVVALSGTLLSIAAVAYAFSRVEWPGRNVVFFLMLSTMMIPAQALIVPQYVLFNRIDWIGTFNPITIPGFFAGGAALIFLLRQFMAQLPRELDEVAMMDGASHIQIWWHIVLPLCRPILATIATFLFIGTWNSLLQPVIYLQTTRLYTLPVFVASLVNPQQTSQPWPTIMAASVLTTLPLILVFFFTQRYLLQSIVLSGGK
jgi:multiple sugar transport system permease protein